MPETVLTGDEQTVMHLWDSISAISRPYTAGEVAAFTGLTPTAARRAIESLRAAGGLVPVLGSRIPGGLTNLRKNATYYCTPAHLARRQEWIEAARVEREEADRRRKAAARADRLLRRAHEDQWQALFETQLTAKYLVEPYNMAPPENPSRWCVVHNNEARNIIRFPADDRVYGAREDAEQALADILEIDARAEGES